MECRQPVFREVKSFIGTCFSLSELDFGIARIILTPATPFRGVAGKGANRK
jgi:hypothetical protein